MTVKTGMYDLELIKVSGSSAVENFGDLNGQYTLPKRIMSTWSDIGGAEFYVEATLNDKNVYVVDRYTASRLDSPRILLDLKNHEVNNLARLAVREYTKDQRHSNTHRDAYEGTRPPWVTSPTYKGPVMETYRTVAILRRYCYAMGLSPAPAIAFIYGVSVDTAYNWMKTVADVELWASPDYFKLEWSE